MIIIFAYKTGILVWNFYHWQTHLRTMSIIKSIFCMKRPDVCVCKRISVSNVSRVWLHELNIS